MSESKRLDQIGVRLPEGLRQKLKESAAANNRSMTAEITHILSTALDSPADSRPSRSPTKSITQADFLGEVFEKLEAQTRRRVESAMSIVPEEMGGIPELIDRDIGAEFDWAKRSIQIYAQALRHLIREELADAKP